MTQNPNGRRGRMMQAPTMAGTARVLVQVSVASLDSAAAAIAAIAGVEVRGRDSSGKLAILFSYGNSGQLVAILRQVSAAQGVTATTVAMRTGT
ncbi:MAG: hypothetical protein FJX54_22880 [Alphaproteobacteria bacterium]|nr:hypothetical protein [Alphaproteobacteria bacterium]